MRQSRKMKRLFGVLIALLLFGQHAMGRAVRTTQSRILLPNGEKVTATLMGDEFLHFYQTADGKKYQVDSLGIAREVNFQALVRKTSSKRKAIEARRFQRRMPKRLGVAGNHYTGSKRGLVILVSFSDLDMHYPIQAYQDYFNKEGYNKDGAMGSVRDYFKAQSYGQFDLTSDVVGPVTVSKAMSYYGKNDSDGNDMYAGEMIAEAVKLADPYVDYRDYDWDGDGEVDQVFVVYASYGEAVEGADPHTIWPHEYTLHDASMFGDGPGALHLDGVLIDTYACSNELAGIAGSVMEGIGAACHEFSHCLGLPDMYDTSGQGLVGMSDWDVMNSGDRLGPDFNSNVPAGYTSYERMFCGWLTPVELTDPCFVQDMPALSDTSVAYVLKNSGHADEYYMFENRQFKGFDSYLPAHGMLILHVDYDADAWENNTVNTQYYHQRMTLIAADNSLDHYTLSGDTWPGTSQNTALTDTSSPATTLYHPNALGVKTMGHSITDISEQQGLISFTFDGGELVHAPFISLVSPIGESQFSISWERVEDADTYEINLTDPMGTSMVAFTSETFHTFSDLDTGTYQVKVRAINGDLFSAWSNMLEVSITSALHQVVSDPQDKAYYDLMGRKVSFPLPKGIYLHQGKKVVIGE